jgi:ABC-type nitrate/sulfonate/bicarbonate transport system substrate-binding protein
LWSATRPNSRHLLFTNTVPTNSGQDADEHLPDDAAEEAADGSENNNEADAGEAVARPLQRSQDAIDQGQDAAREALKDTLPDDEDKAPAS